MPTLARPFFHSRRALLVRSAAAACAALLLGGGCAPASVRSEASSYPPPVTSLTGAPTETLVESATLSFALDRIDQHALPLDHTYRHAGSGRGVTVYVFDGGVLGSHPELAGRVRRGYDAFPGEVQICNAHGTAVAGAVAGTTLGVAPDAEIVDVRMVDCRHMRGTIDAIVRGTRWVIADAARHPGRRAVANWSFIADTTKRVPALDSAVAALGAAGIPVVVAAGNVEMDACRIAPGNSPGTIVVGASRVRRSLDNSGALLDERAPNTAYGPCIDLFAPGDSVLLPSMDGRARELSQLWNGTSMSAGYVSGAVALYLEAHPFATPEQVTDFLHASSAATIVDASRSPRAGMLYVGPAADVSRRILATAAR